MCLLAEQCFLLALICDKVLRRPYCDKVLRSPSCALLHSLSALEEVWIVWTSINIQGALVWLLAEQKPFTCTV